MSIAIAERQVGNRALDVRVVKASQFDDHTPQTPGMLRLAAVSHDLVGSQMLWAGVMLLHTKWVVVRSGREAVVVNLTRAPNGEYVEDGAA